MTNADFERFKAGMASLYLARGRKASDPTTLLFWKRLKAAPIEAFEEAVDKWIDHNNRFPTPKDLRELCGLNPSKGPAIVTDSPYKALTAAERAFGEERGYIDPDQWWAAYGSWQRPTECRCAACRKAGCPSPPILVPEKVTLLDGRQVEMGRELHGDELIAHIAKRNEFEMLMERMQREMDMKREAERELRREERRKAADAAARAAAGTAGTADRTSSADRERAVHRAEDQQPQGRRAEARGRSATGASAKRRARDQEAVHAKGTRQENQGTNEAAEWLYD